MIGRNVVNFYIIDTMLSYLYHAQIKEGGDLHMDSNSENSVKDYVGTWMFPKLQLWPLSAIEALQLALAFYIRKDPSVLERCVLDGLQDLELMQPDDVRQFFVWVYEGLFPHQPFTDVDLNLAVIDNDPMDANLT